MLVGGVLHLIFTVPVEIVKGKIYLIRGQKVLLDTDLAELYDVETKRLNEQVHRNLARFPADFMSQLDEVESAGLRSQSATLKSGRAVVPKRRKIGFGQKGEE